MIPANRSALMFVNGPLSPLLHSSIDIVQRNKHMSAALSVCFQHQRIRGFSMAHLGKTLRNLAKHRDHWAKVFETVGTPAPMPPEVPSRLREVTGFGANPGGLRMLAYVPENLPAASPLVVVLHGCTQTAAGYDHGAGWSTLADRYGFAVLFPEQQRGNNPKLCFNWFQEGDIRREGGEPLSIRQMIERIARDHQIDRRRVFVTGLSAGGAMTAVMLATYPELFAGGAVIAGLPYGAATSVQDAFESMFQGRVRPAREWGDLVRAASSHRGPWPKLSVWHGSADATVKSVNADEIVKQWTNVHGLPAKPTAEDIVDGYPRQVWRDAGGQEVIESFTITSMAHGTPLAAAGGENAYGAAGPFLLEVGISSTYHIATFWGLTGEAVRPAPADVALVSSDGAVELARPDPTTKARAERADHADQPPRAPNGSKTPLQAHNLGLGSLPIDIQAVINKALKAAGLKS
jgi:poly(hydroxyalkanoate) depolymerase family esterase